MAASPERHRGFLAAPRGILKIRIFLTPRGVAIRCFRHSRWLVVKVRHSGMWDARAVKLVSLVSRISTRSPCVPECFNVFPFAIRCALLCAPEGNPSCIRRCQPSS